MNPTEIQAGIKELETQISNLPAGSVAKKTIKGKEYFYHRITENGKRRELYVPADEVDGLRAQIEQRRELERELRKMKKPVSSSVPTQTFELTTNVRMERLWATSRNQYGAIANENASDNFMILSSASRRIRYLYSTVCGGRVKRP